MVKIEDMYCLKCKKPTGNRNITPKISKNNRKYITSLCPICNSMKSKFVSDKLIKGSGVLSDLFKNIPILNKIF